MENAILARQQKRQGLLLHLGGHDIPNLFSPENEDMVRDAAGADLPEGCGGGDGGGNSGGAAWAEAEVQSERGELGAGGRVECDSSERTRVAGG
nr:unnamed protein product [Digitaria exilis]